MHSLNSPLSYGGREEGEHMEEGEHIFFTKKWGATKRGVFI